MGAAEQTTESAMTDVTTRNALTEFDLCLALAQASIDEQLKQAWKAWMRRKSIVDTVVIKKSHDDDGKLIDSKYGLTARLGSLQVSLAVKDGKLGQVAVTLPILHGKVEYYDDAHDRAAAAEFDNGSVSFITDLDKKPVDLKALAAIDSATQETVAKLISDTGLPEDVFSIEYLFLRLTDVDLLISDNREIKLPPLPEAAHTKVLTSLNILLNGEMGEYMMGTVLRRNTEHATPTFAMTDFIFNVRANWDDGRASTLEYLGEFAGRGLPADQTAARLRLADAWLRPEQIDGRESSVAGIMAISRSSVIERLIIAEFSAGIGLTPTQSGLSWAYQKTNTSSHEQKTIIRQIFSTEQSYSLTLTIVPNANRLDLTGSVSAKVHYEGHIYIDDAKTEWIYVEGIRPVTGRIEFEGGSIGTAFRLDTKLAYAFGDPQTTRDEVGGFSVIENALSKLGGSSIENILRNATSSIVDRISTALDRQLRSIAVVMEQHAFIPPGGGVFSFSDPRFSNAGDLVLDVIYLAP